MKKSDQLKTRSGRRIHFKNKDMDFYLMCILANERFEGSSYGEALMTASRIKENDPTSWSSEWIALGRTCQARAERSVAQGHIISAREAYLKAYTYLRWGGHGLSASDPERALNYGRFVECFTSAIPYLDIYVEPIQVPWEIRERGAHMPGYFLSPDSSGETRPTLVIINGGEMYPEDQYFWGGVAAVRRGYNVLTITYEGQPAPTLLFPEWDPIGPDAINDLPGGPFGFMIEYALNRPEVDPSAVAGLGFSGGSYHLLRQASVDDRIRAVVLAPPIFDPLALVEKEFPKALQDAPAAVLKALTGLAGKLNPFTRVVLEGILSMARVATLPEFLSMMQQTIAVDPATVRCPALSLIGEGDSEEEKRQCDVFFESAGNKRKKRVRLQHSEGASAHCQVDNFALFEQIAFDWLDETFEKKRGIQE